MANQIPLYATAGDLLSFCEAVEEMLPLRYVYIRTYTTLLIPVFLTCRQIPLFGIAKHGNMFLEDSFLVMRSSDQLMPQPLVRQDGSTVYSVSAVHHPDSVDFIAGGFFGSDVIIQSSLGALNNEVVRGTLYSSFQKHIKSRAFNIGKYFVAPEALGHFQRGVRLTQSVKLPVTSDLRQPDC